MSPRTLRTFFLTLCVAVGNLGMAAAEPLPAPTAPLKDYEGKGVLQIELPPDPNAKPAADGEKVIDPGFSAWFGFRQAYVRPDRVLLHLYLFNQRSPAQSTLVQGSTERSYSPGTGYIVERSFKNLETATENPIMALQMSMATYARVFQELTTGKLLPEEDLEKLKAGHEARIAELYKARQELATSTNPEDIRKVASAAAESARLRDDLLQIPIRKAHPYYVVEFPNKDVVEKLFSRGLTGGAGAALLANGKTTVWITKAEGLPIKIETTGSDGRVAVHVSFTELKINQGLHPSELTLGAPAGTRLFSLAVDLRNAEWEKKADEDLNRYLETFARERQQRARQERALQGLPAQPPRKK